MVFFSRSRIQQLKEYYLRLDSFFSTFFLQASKQLSSSLSEIKKKSNKKKENKTLKTQPFQESLSLALD